MFRHIEGFLARWKRTPAAAPEQRLSSELMRLQVACALTEVQRAKRSVHGVVQPCLRDDALGTKPTAAAKAHAARLH